MADWFLSEPAPPTEAVRQSYAALERETARLFEIIRRAPGLKVHVSYVDNDAYTSAADLCTELRACRSMSLTTIAAEAPHPLLGGERGGPVDQLRVVHDVFGHAALGLGFDLQSEYATWLQCRTLFSRAARPAAFTELVGAVTAYVATGSKPGLAAKLPPPALLAACEPRNATLWSQCDSGSSLAA